MAARTAYVELHASAGLLDCPLALALRADAPSFHVSMAGAVGAGIAASDIQAHDTAADGGPEGNIDLVLEIISELGTFLSCGATAAEHARKDVAEAAGSLLPPATFEQIGEIEAAEIEALASGTRAGLSAGETTESTSASMNTPCIGFGCSGIDVIGIKSELVVDFPLLGVAEDIVRLGEGFELFFRYLVAGVHVRVILAGKLAESLPDLLSRGALLDAKDSVIVFGLSCHCLLHSKPNHGDPERTHSVRLPTECESNCGRLNSHNRSPPLQVTLSRPSRDTPGFLDCGSGCPFAVHRGQRLHGYVLDAQPGTNSRPFVSVFR